MNPFKELVMNLDIIPDVSFIILDSMYLWREREAHEMKQKLEQQKVPTKAAAGVAADDEERIPKQSMGSIHGMKELLKEEAPITPEMLELISEDIPELAEMDIILDALGFLYYICDSEYALEVIVEYTLPAINQLLRRFFKYDPVFNGAYEHLFHNIVMRLMHHLVSLDGKSMSSFAFIKRIVAAFATSFTTVFAVELITCLTRDGTNAQIYAIDIILAVCQDASKVEKEERIALKAFLKELAAKGALSSLLNLSQGSGGEVKKAAALAYQELYQRTAKYDGRKRFDLWAQNSAAWEQSHFEVESLMASSNDAGKGAKKKR
jgi:hypothetical protein